MESSLPSPKNKALLRPTVIEVGRDGFITVPHVGAFGTSADVQEEYKSNLIDLKGTLPITERQIDTNLHSRHLTENLCDNQNELNV